MAMEASAADAAGGNPLAGEGVGHDSGHCDFEIDHLRGRIGPVDAGPDVVDAHPSLPPLMLRRCPPLAQALGAAPLGAEASVSALLEEETSRLPGQAGSEKAPLGGETSRLPGQPGSEDAPPRYEQLSAG